MFEQVKNGLVFEMQGGLLVDTAKNNTITNSGATLTTDHNGRAGRGWKTDAVTKYITTGNLSVNSAITICVGAKFLGTLSKPILNIFGDTLLEAGISLYSYTSNRYYWRHFNGTTSQDTTSHTYTDTIYNYFTLVVTANQLITYLNGNYFAANTRTINLAFTSKPLTIGKVGIVYSELEIDSIDIYNRILNSNEIVKNYNYWLSH